MLNSKVRCGNKLKAATKTATDLETEMAMSQTLHAQLEQDRADLERDRDLSNRQRGEALRCLATAAREPIRIQGTRALTASGSQSASDSVVQAGFSSTISRPVPPPLASAAGPVSSAPDPTLLRPCQVPVNKCVEVWLNLFLRQRQLDPHGPLRIQCSRPLDRVPVNVCKLLPLQDHGWIRKPFFGSNAATLAVELQYAGATRSGSICFQIRRQQTDSQLVGIFRISPIAPTQTILSVVTGPQR
ncbi:hypothetical protein PI125_g23102 [Phytophthora idaei]|nr:hypothetical protein PI125_g23102 [Phytophthora idaei]